MQILHRQNYKIYTTKITLLIILPAPFRIRVRRFVQFQIPQLDSFRQAELNLGCKMDEHIFTSGLEGDYDDIAEHLIVAVKTLQISRFIKHNRMVKLIDNLLIDNLFQQSKIHHHTEFWGVGVGLRRANHRYKQLITMTMKAAAFAVVIVQCVSRLK